MPYECTVLGDLPPTGADRLSAPTPDALLPSLLSLLPRGRAWQSDEYEVPIGTSVMHRFWRAIGAGLGDAYARATTATLASTVVTADADFLGDWEAELGLPDPCVPPGATVSARRLSARLRMLPGGASKAFLVCYAGRLGWEIEIEEGYRPFECGWSEIGGDDGLGDDEFGLTVIVLAAEADQFFELGAGECGLTPLGERPANEALECAIRRVVHAHLTVWFRYLARSEVVVLAADNAAVTADDGGETADVGTRTQIQSIGLEDIIGLGGEPVVADGSYVRLR